MPTPTGMAAAMPPGTPWNGPAVTIGPRVYVPVGGSDVVSCWDFALEAGCVGFPRPMSGSGYLYSVNADPLRPSCIWTNADYGSAQIQNFDAFTGGTCGEGPVRVLASSIIVPSESCRPASFVSLRIVRPERATYTTGTVTFLDGSGQPIDGLVARSLDERGEVSLVGLGLESQPSLPQFLVALDGSAQRPGEVEVELTWDGAAEADCVKPGTTRVDSPSPAPDDAGPVDVPQLDTPAPPTVTCGESGMSAVACAASTWTWTATARRLRPILRFDSSERYRPLNVATFLRTEPIQFCSWSTGTRACERYKSGSYKQFRARHLNGPDVHMDQLDGTVSNEDAHRTHSRCSRPNGLADCDNRRNPENRIYWQVVGNPDPKHAYAYLNYWFFYRFNGVPFDATKWKHEGDWEGMTFAVARKQPYSKPTFHWAAFDQHGHLWRYLRDALQCGADRGDCLNPDAGSQRVNAYVADGTHASYAGPCERNPICTQTDADGFKGTFSTPEGGHDGKRYWSRNDVGDGLHRYPTSATDAWAFWKGNWNEEQDGERIRTPLAPQRHADGDDNWIRASAPWSKVRCTTQRSRHQCPTTKALELPEAGPASSSRAPAVDPDCPSWFGAGVAVSVCDPGRLATAMNDGTVDGASTLSIERTGGKTADAPGLVQDVGAPLQVGAQLLVRGLTEPGAEARLRVADGNDTTTFVFDASGLDGTGPAKLSTFRAGGGVQATMMLPDGTVIAPRSVRTLTTASAPRLGRPRSLRGAVALVLGASAQPVRIGTARSCAAPLTHVRTVSASTKARRLRLGRGRAGRVVRVEVRAADGTVVASACRRVGPR